VGIVAIANALVAALKVAGFTEAERKPTPYILREDCAARKCVVICRNGTPENGHRGNDDTMIELTICIQKAVENPHSNVEVDPQL
jgi:hypothetical protein